MKLQGKIQKSSGRGKDLGFPTANIPLDEKVEDGLYMGMAEIDPNNSVGNRMPALVFVGAAETFGETERKAEIYILDFEQDIYGEEISVDLLEKLRPVKKFDSPEELVAQMKEDEQIARAYFDRYNDGKVETI